MAGKDSDWVIEDLQSEGFNIDDIIIHPTMVLQPFHFTLNLCMQLTGNVVIQISDHHLGDGENTVLLYYGANTGFTESVVSSKLSMAKPGDYLVTQFEISCVDYALKFAKSKGMKTVYNAAPFPKFMTKETWHQNYPCDWLLVNRSEYEHITLQKYPEVRPESYENATEALKIIKEHTGAANIIVTLGEYGCRALLECGKVYSVPAVKVDKPLDTTGAGDAFLGYFLSSLITDQRPEILRNATQHLDSFELSLIVGMAAAAITITRMGAKSSIPEPQEVYNRVLDNLNSH